MPPLTIEIIFFTRRKNKTLINDQSIELEASPSMTVLLITAGGNNNDYSAKISASSGFVFVLVW